MTVTWTAREDGTSDTTIDAKIYRVRLEPRVEKWLAEVPALCSSREWDRLGSYHPTESAAKADAEEYAEHLRELQSLNRKKKSYDERVGPYTMWGRAQYGSNYGRGIMSYSTAGHGGFRVSETLLQTMHTHLRNAGGWYEEDCEWCKVAVAFPDRFTKRERRMAEDTLKNYFPAAYETQFGRTLAEGESRAKDRMIFDERHKGSWVVISAIRSSQHEGMVEATAMVGGRPSNGLRGGEAKTFLVPSEEYELRSPFGFVVDPARFQELGADVGPTPRP